MNNLITDLKTPTAVKSAQRTGQGVHRLGHLSDIELVLACQSGMQGAFEQLLQRHAAFISSQIYAQYPNANDRADLFQEVVVRMWRFIGSLHNPAAFKGWVARIVANVAYDEMRKRYLAFNCTSLDQAFDHDGNETSSMDLTDPSAQPDEQFQMQEMASQLQRGLAKMNKQYRVALVLRDLEGFSYEEIAKITKSEVGTVKSRIARARGKAQRWLLPYLESRN